MRLPHFLLDERGCYILIFTQHKVVPVYLDEKISGKLVRHIKVLIHRKEIEQPMDMLSTKRQLYKILVNLIRFLSQRFLHKFAHNGLLFDDGEFKKHIYDLFFMYGIGWRRARKLKINI